MVSGIAVILNNIFLMLRLSRGKQNTIFRRRLPTQVFSILVNILHVLSLYFKLLFFCFITNGTQNPIFAIH